MWNTSKCWVLIIKMLLQIIIPYTQHVKVVTTIACWIIFKLNLRLFSATSRQGVTVLNLGLNRVNFTGSKLWIHCNMIQKLYLFKTSLSLKSNHYNTICNFFYIPGVVVHRYNTLPKAHFRGYWTRHGVFCFFPHGHDMTWSHPEYRARLEISFCKNITNFRPHHKAPLTCYHINHFKIFGLD